MQKNNLCPILNKVLLYEETDSFSQSNFNPNKKKYVAPKKNTQIKKKYLDNIGNKINQLNNNNTNDIIHINKKKNISKKNQIDKNKNNSFNLNKFLIRRLKIKYKNEFELYYYLFSLNYIINNYKIFDDYLVKEYIEKFYTYNHSISILPKKEFYYYHHMLFLERPNYNNIYFNKIKRNIGLEKLNIYQNQRKKEYKIDQLNNKNSKENEKENGKKIFDTNVLETIENYSTTITQEPNNEKPATLTPFEIFKRCEDTSKRKKFVNNNNEQKSIITFSESEISYKSRNIVDESLIAVVKEISGKPNKFKIYKQEKKYINNFIKNKNIQKFTKNNKNTNININNTNLNKNMKNNYNNHKYNGNNKNNIYDKYDSNNEEKEIMKKKTVSTSTNRKTKKKIIIDMLYQNFISKSSSKKESFINNVPSSKGEENKNANFASFGTTRKNKGVLNLKKQSYTIKTHATKFSDNYIMEGNLSINNNNINKLNNNNNYKLLPSYVNNIDKLLTSFLTPKNKNLNKDNYNKSKSKYDEFNYNFKKRQIKKNTTLTIVNNNIINNSQNSLEKYKNISNYKSKSPLTRLFLNKNNYASNSKKNYKKKKSVLIPELKNNSQITKCLNKYFFEQKSDENKNLSSNNINNKHLNIMALGKNIRNSYQYMKLNKYSAKKTLLK